MRLGGADDGGLIEWGVVRVNDADATKGCHGNSHRGLSDGVHWGGDAGDGEVEVAAKFGGELDRICWEVDEVREEDYIIVRVRVSLAE